MRYSIQCRYSMVEQTFMFIIRSAQDNNTYEFTWLISNVDQPVYLLTNNDIILKAQMEDNYVMFSVAESKKPLNENIVMTKTVPMMVFETDKEQLQILYDYDHLPTKRDKYVGMIVNAFLNVSGGGFLQNVEDYNYLQENIANIIDEYKKDINTKKKKKTAQKKESVGDLNASNIVENEVNNKKTKNKEKKIDKKEIKEVKAKTNMPKTKKTSKKAGAK